MAVRAPFEPQIAVAVAVLVFAVQHRAYSLGVEVHHTQVAAILEEGNLLAVRAELWLL